MVSVHLLQSCRIIDKTRTFFTKVEKKGQKRPKRPMYIFYNSEKNIL